MLLLGSLEQKFSFKRDAASLEWASDCIESEYWRYRTRTNDYQYQTGDAWTKPSGGRPYDEYRPLELFVKKCKMIMENEKIKNLYETHGSLSAPSQTQVEQTRADLLQQLGIKKEVSPGQAWCSPAGVAGVVITSVSIWLSFGSGINRPDNDWPDLGWPYWRECFSFCAGVLTQEPGEHSHSAMHMWMWISLIAFFGFVAGFVFIMLSQIFLRSCCSGLGRNQGWCQWCEAWCARCCRSFTALDNDDDDFVRGASINEGKGLDYNDMRIIVPREYFGVDDVKPREQLCCGNPLLKVTRAPELACGCSTRACGESANPNLKGRFHHVYYRAKRRHGCCSGWNGFFIFIQLVWAAAGIIISQSPYDEGDVTLWMRRWQGGENPPAAFCFTTDPAVRASYAPGIEWPVPLNAAALAPVAASRRVGARTVDLFSDDDITNCTNIMRYASCSNDNRLRERCIQCGRIRSQSGKERCMRDLDAPGMANHCRQCAQEAPFDAWQQLASTYDVDAHGRCTQQPGCAFEIDRDLSLYIHLGTIDTQEHMGEDCMQTEGKEKDVGDLWVSVTTALMTLFMALSMHFDVNRRDQLEAESVRALKSCKGRWLSLSTEEKIHEGNQLVKETEAAFMGPTEGLIVKEQEKEEDGKLKKRKDAHDLGDQAGDHVTVET